MSANQSNSEAPLLTKEQLANYDEYLLTKKELADRLRMKVRGIEFWVQQRKIPVLRIIGKCVRFSWPAVRRALQKYEEKAIG